MGLIFNNKPNSQQNKPINLLYLIYWVLTALSVVLIIGAIALFGSANSENTNIAGGIVFLILAGLLAIPFIFRRKEMIENVKTHLTANSQSLYHTTSSSPPITESADLLREEVHKINMSNAYQLKTDIVEAIAPFKCCEKCIIYGNRWYSISGKDKRFPKMPSNYKCQCTGIDFSPVILGVSEPSFELNGKGIIEWSNRPFVNNTTSSTTSSLDG